MDHVVVVLDPLPEDLGGAAAFVAQRFRIPEDRALQLLRRAPGPVTKAVPEAQARTVAAILAEAGLHVEMREGGPDGPAVPFAAPVSAPTPVPDARPGAPDAADGGEPQAAEPAGAGPDAAEPDAAEHAGRVPPAEPVPGREDEPVASGAGEAAFDPRAEALRIPPSPARARAAGDDAASADAADRDRDDEAVAAHDRAEAGSESAASAATEPEAPPVERSVRSTQVPPAGATTTTPPRDPMKTTLTREPPDVERHGLSRRIATAATLPAVLTLLAALLVLTFTLLPLLRAQQAERAQGTATAVAATVEGLSGGLPLSSPLVRTQLRAVEDRTASQLATQGVSFMAIVEPDGNVLLGWESGAADMSPATRDLALAAARGELADEPASWTADLARTWETLLSVVGLRRAEPVVAAARMERSGSPLGAVVVGVDPSGLRGELGRVLLTSLLVGLVPVLFAVLAALSLTRGVTDAVRYLLVATDRISHGDFEKPVELERDDELGQIAGAVERMRISLREGMERLRRRR